MDLATGAMYDLKPNPISVKLEKKATATAPLQALITQIEKPGLTIEKLKELEELRKAGALTDEEYARLKSKLLEDFTSTSQKQPGPQVPAPEEKSTTVLAYAASMKRNLDEETNLFVDQYRTAYESADINKFMALYSKSAVENGKGYEDIRLAYQKFFENGNRYTYNLKKQQIQQNDTNISMTCAYSLEKVGETKTVVDGNIRWTLVRENEGLLIVKAEY